MTTDTVTTSEVQEAVKDLFIPSSFVLDTFFPRVKTFKTREVVVDILKGKRRLSPFVAPRVKGRVVESLGRSTKIFTPAYIKDLRQPDPEQAFDRSAGEAIGGGDLDPSQRMALAVATELEDGFLMWRRRLELMGAEALRTGKVVISGEDYPEVTVDFLRDATLTVAALAGTARWGETTSKPLNNLTTWASAVMKLSGTYPFKLLFEADAWAAFRTHAQIISRLDTRNAPGATLDLGNSDKIGGLFMGVVDKFECYLYQDWYTDANGVDQPVLPSGTVMGASPSVEGRQLFGAIKDLKAGLQPLPFFAKTWEEEDPSALNLLMQSAPLVAPFRPDASFCSVNVLG